MLNQPLISGSGAGAGAGLSKIIAAVAVLIAVTIVALGVTVGLAATNSLGAGVDRSGAGNGMVAAPINTPLVPLPPPQAPGGTTTTTTATTIVAGGTTPAPPPPQTTQPGDPGTTGPPVSQTTQAPPPPLPTTPAPPLPAGFSLPATTPGTLFVVESGVRSNGQPRVVARSYDNQAWEAMRDEDFRPMSVVCRTPQSNECVLEGAATPNVRELPVPDRLKNVNAEATAARLLTQGTFGPTKAEVAALAAVPNQAEAWIASEMGKPVSMLRAYVRARTNPTNQDISDLANLVGICDVGARYRPVTSGGTSANSQTIATNNLDFTPVGQENHVAISRVSNCDATKVQGTTAFLVHNGQTYRWVPRVKLLQNDLGNPAGGTSGDMCPSVPKTFVNGFSCVRRASCGSPASRSVEVPLNQASLRKWFSGSQRYVYYVTGLRLEGVLAVSPCAGTSRWLKSNGACPAASNLNTATINLFSAGIRGDSNEFVRDIELPGGNGCVANAGTSLVVDNDCWTHVHPETYSVRDFTNWGDVDQNLHPGNKVGGTPRNPNPIYKWAAAGGVELPYPASHPMTRFGEENLKHIPVIGRYGDRVDYLALATELQTADFAAYAGASSTGVVVGAFESCGAPGEVKNDGTLGHRYTIQDTDLSSSEQRAQLDWNYNLDHGKSMAWLNHAFKAPDQLRQRVAWALQQIFVIGDNGDMSRREVESWTTYYDIFTRHAFGNYRDMMKEVSFHPLMSRYLTFRGSESFERTNRFPDENYAREIMQLFSVGLYMLNEDGTRIVENNDFVDSYTDTDIVDFSRIWTGFDIQNFRSNTEQMDGRNRNGLDPLQIKAANRDKLPKAKLDEGYIGDQYPLCEDLPSEPWFRPGAKFVYTGAASDEGEIMDTHDAAIFVNRPRFAPVENSPLYNALCGIRTSGGQCTFPSEVTLTSVLTCTGTECGAEDVHTLMMTRGSQVGYYTYVRQPCTKLTWFNDGRILSFGNSHQCGNRKLPIGNPVCCRPTDTDRFDSNENTAGLCHHANERASYDTVKARCEAAGLIMCKDRQGRYPNWKNSCAERMSVWVDETCPLKVQVLPTGRVMVNDNGTIPFLRESNGNQFRIRWENEVFPKAAGGGCGAGCQMVATASDSTCVCDITETTTALFSAAVPSAAQVLNTARIGAFPPSSYDANAYTLCTTTECVADNQLKVWVKAGSADWKNENTIFEVSLLLHAGDLIKFLMNKLSTVSLTGQPAIKFRNPPHFMPLMGEFIPSVRPWRSTDQWLPAAHLEVDALIDHLFYHKNTAPFVAYRMIQRMVTSNPSLRYVKSVAQAFKSGRFNGKTYSGRYGDMAATVAAVLLDQEARSVTVEADPLHGSIHEPLLKLIRFMRTLEFKTKDGREIHMPTLQDRIEQQAFKTPSVFGFYLPEFRPDGPVEDNGLVAPEAQIMTTPSTIHYFNGMSSLVNNGLTSCDGGFGYSSGRNCRDTSRKRSTADGNLTFAPTGTTPAEVISELDLLLTSQRLSPQTTSYLVAEYTKELAADGSADALRKALKRFMLTVEFQINNAHVLTNVVRQASAVPSAGGGRPFKAIVVVFQGGGADSYNLIVPHSGCGKDYYAEYASVRGNAAIPKNSLLQIGVAGQPCTTFGVHPEMDSLTQLYNENDAAFFANIGGLVEPLTVAEYKDRRSTKLKPPSPSAHNIAQRTLQTVHAQESNAKGILGRAVDVLKGVATPFVSEMYSLAGNAKMLQSVLSKPDLISPYSGVVSLQDKAFVTAGVENVTGFESKSVLGETYASLVGVSLKKSEQIGQLLANSGVASFGTERYQRTLHQVARLISIRAELKTERAVFFTSRGGWDTHTSLTPPWASVDNALGAFQAEMKRQGVWNNVVVVSVSDFGRTMTSNGDGTDHAWAGNHFIAGGGVKGGRFHGKFPDTLKPEGPLNLGGRGRLVPTLGWESMWKGILEWFDVPADKMNEVLPNMARYPNDKLLHRNDLFN